MQTLDVEYLRNFTSFFLPPQPLRPPHLWWLKTFPKKKKSFFEFFEFWILLFDQISPVKKKHKLGVPLCLLLIIWWSIVRPSIIHPIWWVGIGPATSSQWGMDEKLQFRDFFGWDEWKTQPSLRTRVLGRSCVSFSHDPWPQQLVFFVFPFVLVFLHSLFLLVFASLCLFFNYKFIFFIFFLFALHLLVWFFWVFALCVFFFFFSFVCFCVYSSCVGEGGGAL